MHWEILERDKARQFVRKISNPETEGLFTPATSEVKFHDLSFYKDYKLYRVTNYASLPSFSFDYLSDGNQVFRLDGNPDPIYETNVQGMIQLNAQNVFSYLDFFLTHVQSEEGDVFSVTDISKLSFFESMPLSHQDFIKENILEPQISYEVNLGAFVITATMYFIDTLANTVMQIEESGEVSVIDQEMLLQSGMPDLKETPYDTMRV